MRTINSADMKRNYRLQNSFHGRTVYRHRGRTVFSDYAPLPQDITHLPYNDIDAVKAAFSSRTCAVIVEPIIGEGGVMPADPQFLQVLRGCAISMSNADF